MIYIASKTIHAEKWKRLRAQGLPINSTWIDEAGPGESKSLTDLWVRCIREASEAKVLIVYSRHNEVLKGAFVEIGAALASKVPVLAVGLPPGLSVLNHPLVEVHKDLSHAIIRATNLLRVL